MFAICHLPLPAKRNSQSPAPLPTPDSPAGLPRNSEDLPGNIKTEKLKE